MQSSHSSRSSTSTSTSTSTHATGPHTVPKRVTFTASRDLPSTGQGSNEKGEVIYDIQSDFPKQPNSNTTDEFTAQLQQLDQEHVLNDQATSTNAHIPYFTQVNHDTASTIAE